MRGVPTRHLRTFAVQAATGKLIGQLPAVGGCDARYCKRFVSQTALPRRGHHTIGDVLCYKCVISRKVLLRVMRTEVKVFLAKGNDCLPADVIAVGGNGF